MALINCPDCEKQVSSNAATCPNCGAPIAGALPDTDRKAAVMQATAEVAGRSETQVTESRKVSGLLVAGIVVMPYLFAWFTLRKGYSTKARAMSFGWLAVFAVGMVGQQMEKGANRDAATREAFEEQNQAALVAPACEAHRDAVVDALPIGARLVDVSCEEHGWVKVQVLAPPSTHENRAKHILTNTVRRMAENDYSPRTRDLTILLFSLALEKTVTGETRSVIDSAATYYPTVDEVRITE